MQTDIVKALTPSGPAEVVDAGTVADETLEATTSGEIGSSQEEAGDEALSPEADLAQALEIDADALSAENKE